MVELTVALAMVMAVSEDVGRFWIPDPKFKKKSLYYQPMNLYALDGLSKVGNAGSSGPWIEVAWASPSSLKESYTPIPIATVMTNWV